MKAVVFTLGCKVNECESDSLIAGLVERGYQVSDKLEVADLYIVNTCAVTAEAEKKSRQTASRIKKLNPSAKIIFTGCASEKSYNDFAQKSDAYLVTGVFNKNKILDMLDNCGIEISPPCTEFEELNTVKTLRTRTYVKVQDGCNNFCSYCIIPYLRGRSRSRSPVNVKQEIIITNPQEAVINGINLSAYDFNGKNLTNLIQELKDVDCRIRLGSLEVGIVNDEFLRALKSLKNFAPHFHLSLQSGSDAVLKKMNRHYSTKEYYEKVELIREYFADAGITTDIIVGFPTETEQDFINTLEFVDKVKFSDIHPFIFSARQGTVASKMKELAPEIKQHRQNLLMDKKQKVKNAFIQKIIGTEQEVLFEEILDGYAQGYSGNYVRVYVKDPITCGRLNKVKILGEYKDGAIAELI